MIPDEQEENNNIMRDIDAAEIFTAIKGCSSRKSPGSDGLPKEFYLKTWSIIRAEFVHIINDTLQGNSSKEFHDGVIVLIKKKGRDKTIKGYRPISLLNVD